MSKRDKSYNCFGQSLRTLREQRGWSRRQLGAQAGMSASTIEAIEMGHEPLVYSALWLAMIFETTVEKLCWPDTPPVLPRDGDER